MKDKLRSTSKVTTTRTDFDQVLRVLANRIAIAVQASRKEGDVTDNERGVIFPPQLIIRDALSAKTSLPALSLKSQELPESLNELIGIVGLSDLEVGLLLLAAVTSVDPRFEHFFIVLNNEVSTRGPTVSTALRLLGEDPSNPVARALLDPQAPLRSLGLIRLHRPEHSLAAQILDSPERVVRHLLGDRAIGPEIVNSITIGSEPILPRELLPILAFEAPEATRQPLFPPASIGLRARPGTAGVVQAQHWLLSQGFPAVVTYDRSAEAIHKETIETEFSSVIREAALRGLPVVVDMRRSDSEVGRRLSDLCHKSVVPVVAIYPASTQPESIRMTLVDLPMSTAAQREAWWDHLDAKSTERNTLLRLEPEEILGRITGVPSRKVESTSSGAMARKVIPQFTLDEVIAEESVSKGLEQLVNRVKLRTIVLDDWDMRPGGIRGRGITALLAGPSGTGKTMAAEALAGALGVPLFHVDLSSVVDKYIGETEKNLERVFSAAENVDGVLLFDEADALFGKRSDVSDARDRHANIEVAFLLQRMESFDGLAILTSNLRSNLDEAFTRRLDCIIDFTDPHEALRGEIWRRCTKGRAPELNGDQFQKLALLELSGGAIRSAVVSAAYQAAAEGTDIRLEHLVEGARNEWLKMGRLGFPI
jgi:AAA+ superfamily predicted ATPase